LKFDLKDNNVNNFKKHECLISKFQRFKMIWKSFRWSNFVQEFDPS